MKYIIIIPCRVLHSEYIFQLPNHARDGACRSHWSTTGLILYGWPNKNFELNIIDMRRRGLCRGRTYIFEIKIVLKITLLKFKWSFWIVKEWKITNLFFYYILKDEVLITLGCPIFASILTAKYLFTGSLTNRSIDNLETQKKYISMRNSQFFNYLLYAKSK